MHALRIPFAAITGALLSAALFLGLWRLISVPMEWHTATAIAPIEFTPKLVETPTESKRDPKIVREPPPVLPPSTRIGTDRGGDVTRVVLTKRPAVDVTVRDGGFDVGSDRDVIPLVRFPPDYPPSAAARGTEGWVQVRFTITAAGTVRDAIVVGADPPKVFDKAALEAIARWRYNPRVQGGVAVERVGVETLIRFDLE